MSAWSGRKRMRRWFLLVGDRYAVAACLLGSIALLLLLVGAGPAPEDRSALFYLYSALIGGNITLITIVVSINQLVLAREFGTPGELRAEIRETAIYRQQATDRSAVVTEPAEFLRGAIGRLRDGVRRIEPPAESSEPTRRELDRLRSSLTEHTDRVDTRLSGDDSDLFDVVFAVFRARYVDRIQSVRRLRSTHDLPEEIDDALDALLTQLEDLDIARHYFLTIYVSHELSHLSRVLLYAGLPAVAISMAMLVSLTGPSQAGGSAMFGLVVLTATIGLLPLSLLASFVARIATVAQHVAITPFEMP
jgi:hypothetical protein